MRILLLYRKGLDSCESLRTVNGILFPTYKEALTKYGIDINIKIILMLMQSITIKIILMLWNEH